MEPGLICYQCVGTHPGCSLHDFDWRWYWGKTCPRSDDRCVKVKMVFFIIKDAKYAVSCVAAWRAALLLLLLPVLVVVVVLLLLLVPLPKLLLFRVFLLLS